MVWQGKVSPEPFTIKNIFIPENYYSTFGSICFKAPLIATCIIYFIFSIIIIFLLLIVINLINIFYHEIAIVREPSKLLTFVPQLVLKIH